MPGYLLCMKSVVYMYATQYPEVVGILSLTHTDRDGYSRFQKKLNCHCIEILRRGNAVNLPPECHHAERR